MMMITGDDDDDDDDDDDNDNDDDDGTLLKAFGSERSRRKIMQMMTPDVDDHW